MKISGTVLSGAKYFPNVYRGPGVRVTTEVDGSVCGDGWLFLIETKKHQETDNFLRKLGNFSESITDIYVNLINSHLKICKARGPKMQY